MSVRRVHSPERTASCFSFARFFQNNNSNSTNKKPCISRDEIKYHDEQHRQRFSRFMDDYTDQDLSSGSDSESDNDYDSDNEKKSHDDEATLIGNEPSKKQNNTNGNANSKEKRFFAEFDSTDRLKELRDLMRKHEIGVYIIPSEDEHQSEYTAPKDHRRQYISGFTGSAGIAVVSLDHAALSTDGRYYLQAEQQLDSNWELLKATVPSYPTWQEWCVSHAASQGQAKSIGIDPKLITKKNGDLLKEKCSSRGIEFKMVSENLIDTMWDSNGERPAFGNSTIYELDLKYSGVHPNAKIAKIRKVLKDQKCSSLVVTALDDIAWLFNLRGDDVTYNPVFFSYAVVLMDEVFFYIDSAKIDFKTDPNLEKYLKSIDDLTIKPYEQFWIDIPNFTQAMIPGNPSLALAESIPQIQQSRSLIGELKSFKNDVEIDGAKNAQFKDSIALARYFAWLEYQLLVKSTTTLTEWDAALKCEYYRTKLPLFKGLSFDTISSTGANGAIIHYSPTAEKSDIIDAKQVYLCDSGAQYLDGTTDITRSMHFMTPTKEQIKNYTLVLKGHVALAAETFLAGTNGAQLDILSRTPLWKHGLNYNHGTGHGIGSFLCVHEGPVYIGTAIEIKPRYFISDEPGFYKDGEYGLRIESELLCVEDTDEPKFNEKAFLKFEYCTLVPFCRKLIDPSMLTNEEIKWINEFNYNVRERVIPVLEKDFGDVRAIRWVLRETDPI